MPPSAAPRPPPRRALDAPRLQRAAPGLLVWAVAWAAMAWLDGHVDLGSQALLLVLAAALAGVWWPLWASVLGNALAIAAFNWFFVPPRGSLHVDLRQHSLLLATMLAVGWVVAGLMTRQRALARREAQHARQAAQLQALGDALRDTDDPLQQAGALQQALAATAPGGPDGAAALFVLTGPLPAHDDMAAGLLLGRVSADQQTGLWLCLRQSVALGPGSGRHEYEGDCYLPLRGRGGSFGAALLPWSPGRSAPVEAAARRAHAQALCDQMGLALERAAALRAAAVARDEAQLQRLRNTLLASISHDYRTPLASILGAASSLQDQGERLSPAQRTRVAATIVDEVEQLSRLTENTLQLARLDAPGLVLRSDWESAEEIVGSVLRRLRQRDPARRLRVRLEPGLPLLRCDAVLLVQLLDNLVDNALKYGGGEAPVEIVVRRSGDMLLLAVRDRGPGVPPAWRERVFDAFQRGAAPGPGASATSTPSPDTPARRGAGVGLALCRAIARAHGGRLTLRTRRHGGSSFECSLPLAVPPMAPPTMPDAIPVATPPATPTAAPPAPAAPDAAPWTTP